MLIYHSTWTAQPTAPNTVGFVPYHFHLNTVVKPTIKAHGFIQTVAKTRLQNDGHKSHDTGLL
jgi:hypothetical protein